MKHSNTSALPQNELSIIAQTRNEVVAHRAHTGENLFLVWGYPTAFFLLVEFAALILWGADWCNWLWLGIPLVGAPLMIHDLRQDYERTGHRTHDSDLALKLWIFIGFASAVMGFATGCADLFDECYCTFQGLLVGFGCFLTGIISRFRRMTVCGIVGSLLTFASLFFQGDMWPYQLLIASLITVISLIIPGHLLKQYIHQVEE